MNLLIVESPNKIKKLKSILGPGWEVAASVGHICDLPPKELGIEKAKRYQLNYIVNADKVEVVEKLRRLVDQHGKANVYLATDPDREGEAIAYHLCKRLELDHKTTKRVTFQEITAPAIQKAVAAPRFLDMPLVAAQEGRRAVDRLVGYEISPVLWKKVGSGLSAGRVQSVAVRLVVDRENLILGFADKFSFGVTGTFTTPAGETLTAKRKGSFPAVEAAETYLLSTVNQVYRVQSVETKPVETKPPAAYSTSTMQQDAVKKLKIGVKKAMELAQKLFEEGHITYMRTDSVNLSDTAIAEAKEQIENEFGPEYFQERKFKNKDSAQEAHEAIRPTHWDVRVAGNTAEEQALYQLIHSRAMASQMAAARYDRTDIQLASELPEDEYKASTRVLTFEGYRKAYQEVEEEGEKEAETAVLRTAVRPGETLVVQRLDAKQNYAKPPGRYDEATLVADLEKRGIGRPATYASILSNIVSRNYIVSGDAPGRVVPVVILTLAEGKIKKDQKNEKIGADKAKLLPTATGRQVTEFLEKHFDRVVDYSFTASCETNFDQIAAGQLTYVGFLGPFDQMLSDLINQVNQQYPDQVRDEQRSVGELEGEAVVAGKGKHGPYVKWRDEYYSVGVEPEQVTLAIAQAAIAAKKQNQARTLGTWKGKPLLVGKGKAGTYVRWGEDYFNAGDREPVAIDEATAHQIVTEALAAQAANLVHTVGKYEVRRKKDDLSSFFVLNTKKDERGFLRKGTKIEEVMALTEADCQEAIKSTKAWLKKNKK